MPHDVSSLRERKRLATYAAISQSAARLVHERGYDAVTVEDICAEAGVSRRTFFNYMDSKEGAVLGPAMTIPEKFRTAFLEAEHPNLLRAVLNLLVEPSIFAERANGPETLRLRRAVFKENPTLLAMHIMRNISYFDETAATTVEYLKKHPDRQEIPDISIKEEAHYTVGLAWAALHAGMRQWFSGKSQAGSLREACHHALTMMCLLERNASEF